MNKWFVVSGGVIASCVIAVLLLVSGTNATTSGGDPIALSPEDFPESFLDSDGATLVGSDGLIHDVVWCRVGQNPEVRYEVDNPYGQSLQVLVGWSVNGVILDFFKVEVERGVSRHNVSLADLSPDGLASISQGPDECAIHIVGSWDPDIAVVAPVAIASDDEIVLE